jgi:hypothetical protein
MSKHSNTAYSNHDNSRTLITVPLQTESQRSITHIHTNTTVILYSNISIIYMYNIQSGTSAVLITVHFNIKKHTELVNENMMTGKTCL